jgi:MFS family permease
LPWTVLAITGDPRQMAVVLAAGSVARVLALLIGGALADRLSPRLVMLTADAGRTVDVAVLGATLFIGLPPLWVVALLAGFEGLGSVLFMPGVFAIIPSTVPEEQLPGANGLMQVIQFLSLIFGPILGGVATATQASFALLADAGSFLVSTLTLGAMRLPRRPRATGAGIGNDILAGLRYAFGMPLLRTTMVVSILANIGLVGTSGVALIVLVRNLTHDPVTLGIFLALVGFGGIVGRLSAAALGRLKRRGLITICLWGVTPPRSPPYLLQRAQEPVRCQWPSRCLPHCACRS